jgi:glycosyltransferase involved in cell wall biosynthesis
VIPHGVDRETFRRLPGERREAKEEAFPDRPELHEARIVLNGNRGWERKRLDLTLEGFARFAAHGPEDVHLVLRLPGSGREERRRLVDRADALGLGDRVAVGRDGWRTATQLTALYNACEVGVNTAMGEGWGLISCEHGATGNAQIVTDDEQLREIWGAGATYLETEGTEAHWACPHVEYRVPSPDGLAAELQALFGDRELLCDRSRAAAERMAHPRFDWRSIEAEWAQLFEEVLAPGAWQPGSSRVAREVAAGPPDSRR